MAHWLMKSEPGVFSIDDLERLQTTPWEGVRNYQARNFIRSMKKGDCAFLYHSSCAEPAAVGVMEICGSACPDPTQFDRRSPYYDPGSRRDAPRWLLVDVSFRRRLRRPVTLAAMRGAAGLGSLALLQRGNRLSVMPVSPREWSVILGLEQAQAPSRHGSH